MTVQHHPARGRTAKHSGTVKHRKHQAAGAKHQPSARTTWLRGFHAGVVAVTSVAKQPKPNKPRQSSPGGLVACCPAEAVAASARLAGWAVSAQDVLNLYARVADGTSSGFTIAAALLASARFGLAGGRPAFAPVPPDAGDEAVHAGTYAEGAEELPEIGPRHALILGGTTGWDSNPHAPISGHSPCAGYGHTAPDSTTAHGRPFGHLNSLILGVDLPGPHAVTVAPDGCWVSWGEHYDPAEFPGAMVEEAWLVEWPQAVTGA